MSEEVTLDDFAEQDEDGDASDEHPRFGLLPDEWKISEISNIAEVVGGSTPSTSNEDYWGGGIPWATPTDITALSGNTISETEDTITEEGLESASTHLLPPKSVLMTSRATIGKCAINTVDMATNQGFKNLVPSDEIEPWYLYYRMLDTAAFLNSLGSGSTFDEVSKTEVQSVDIPIPSLPEQRKIATVLYTVDRAIEKAQEIIDQTERVRRGYIKQQVLALDSDYDRQEGVVGTRRVSIPDSWETVRLGDVARIVSGKSFPREYQEGHAGSRAVIKVEDMNLPGNDKYIEEVTNRVTDEVLDELSKNIFPENTVIHPRVGEALLLNKTRITGEDAAFDDNIMGWVPEGIDSEYLYYASTLIDFNAVAQTGTVPSINKEMAANFRFPLPPEEEQKRIARDISRVDGQISIYEEEKNHLQRLKRGLMQDLLSGTVRTTDTNIEVPEEIAQYG